MDFGSISAQYRLPWTVRESIFSLKDDITARGSRKGAILTRQMPWRRAQYTQASYCQESTRPSRGLDTVRPRDDGSISTVTVAANVRRRLQRQLQAD